MFPRNWTHDLYELIHTQCWTNRLNKTYMTIFLSFYHVTVYCLVFNHMIKIWPANEVNSWTEMARTHTQKNIIIKLNSTIWHVLGCISTGMLYFLHISLLCNRDQLNPQHIVCFKCMWYVLPPLRFWLLACFRKCDSVYFLHAKITPPYASCHKWYAEYV